MSVRAIALESVGNSMTWLDSPSVSDLLEAHASVGELLAEADGAKSVPYFASLLLDASLQSNCIRIEALVHIAAAYCKGSGIWFRR